MEFQYELLISWKGTSCKDQYSSLSAVHYLCWIHSRSQLRFKNAPLFTQVVPAHRLTPKYVFTEWFGLGQTFKGHLVKPSCNKQGHQPHQGAQVEKFMSKQEKTSYMRE